MNLTDISTELTTHIIPFWKQLKDEEKGGFYGYCNYNLKVNKRAVKSVILHSRILWFFSRAYQLTKDPECLDLANHTFAFIRDHCLDKKYGGVFWSVTNDGQMKDSIKHTYNQAFAIYALSTYYEVSKNPDGCRIAIELFLLVEEKMKDSIGYMESFNRKFQPVDNDQLSEHGYMAERTMNTLLHVLEAYTQIYKVTLMPEVKEALHQILDLFADCVYNPKEQRLDVFFDHDMKSIANIYSYGHDIEASWLLDRCVEVLDEDLYTKKIHAITRKLVQNVYETAFDGHSLSNEDVDGSIDTTRVWWVQAEAVVGFLNAYQQDESKREYLDAAEKILQFIQSYIVDTRVGSEWFYHVSQTGVPEKGREIAGPWKCPYHNGRMCIEVLERMSQYE